MYKLSSVTRVFPPCVFDWVNEWLSASVMCVICIKLTCLCQHFSKRREKGTAKIHYSSFEKSIRHIFQGFTEREWMYFEINWAYLNKWMPCYMLNIACCFLDLTSNFRGFEFNTWIQRIYRKLTRTEESMCFLSVIFWRSLYGNPVFNDDALNTNQIKNMVRKEIFTVKWKSTPGHQIEVQNFYIRIDKIIRVHFILQLSHISSNIDLFSHSRKII